MANRIDRLKEQQTDLKRKIASLMQSGKYAQASGMMRKLNEIEVQIEEAEAQVPRALSQLFDKKTLNESGINKLIVEVHLAADFLADCAYELKDAFDKLGVQETKLVPLLDEIKKRSQSFASIVCHPEFAGLSDFMVTNEEFINAMHEISQKYINDHLTITDE